jgi:hypothetical protein
LPFVQHELNLVTAGDIPLRLVAADAPARLVLATAVLAAAVELWTYERAKAPIATARGHIGSPRSNIRDSHKVYYGI